MGEEAFRGANIDTVTFSPNIKEIPSRAFAYSQIKELVIPSTIKRVNEFAFLDCHELNKITVEEGVESIGNKAFMNCYSIYEENIDIPQSVRVASDAFLQTPLDGNIPAGYEKPSSTTKPQAIDKPQATAAPEEKPEVLTVKGDATITVAVGDKAVEFPDAQPFVDENGRTQVPVRAVSEMLNCKVDWDGENKIAKITRENGDIIKLTLDSDIMTVNDKSVQMDTSAIIKDDRTYIPVRFVAEAMGLEVEWIE